MTCRVIRLLVILALSLRAVPLAAVLQRVGKGSQLGFLANAAEFVQLPAE